MHVQLHIFEHCIPISPPQVMILGSIVYGNILFELRLMHAAFLVLHARYLNAIGRNVGAGVPSVS